MPPFVLRLAYDETDFKMVRTHWSKNFVRKFPPREPVHRLTARVLYQIRTDGYVVREHYLFPLKEVTTPGEHTREEQMYCALHQLNSVMFSFEAPAPRQFHVRRLLDDTKERQTGCVDGLVTLLCSPALRNYLLNVAQLAQVLPTPESASLRPGAMMTSGCHFSGRTYLTAHLLCQP